MISLIGETKKNDAFTLVEILLVITIAGVILALAAPNFSKGYSRFELNKTADDLVGVSRWAQAMAIGQERVYVLSFSDDRRSYGLVRSKSDEGSSDQEDFEPVNGALGRIHTVPEAVHLDSDEDRIEFHPDGTIDGAAIHLKDQEQKILLTSADVRGMMIKVNDD